MSLLIGFGLACAAAATLVLLLGDALTGLLIGFGGVLALLLLSALRRIGEGRRFRRAAQAIIDRHADVLTRKYHQQIYRDDYGTLCLDRWQAEVRYFVNSVLAPELTAAGFAAAREQRDALGDQVRAAAEAGGPPALIFAQGMSGEDFERLCAGILEAAGWQVRTTPRSGDQGVDLVAQRSGVQVALQCKRNAARVGNKAVQEALAGARFEGCTHAAVVSNADFTESARQLAGTTGVLLLHYADLRQLEERLTI